MRIVITGGPCTGKTSLINYLESVGHTTVPEAGRLVIEKLKDSFKWPAKDFRYMQLQILLKQLELESKIPVDARQVFYDRSALDNFGYCEQFGVEPPEELYEYAEKTRFDKVFHLEPIGKFTPDRVRYETPEQAREIHELIAKVYRKFGYSPIKVPLKDTIYERYQFILRDLKQNGK
jgi:predicted ATPase